MKPYALQKISAERDLGGWTAFDVGADEPADYCSRAGAESLKAKIETYWRDRGQNVMIALHNVGFHPAIRAARFDVRSDMVNGMPRTGAAAKAAPKEIYVEDFAAEDDDLAFE